MELDKLQVAEGAEDVLRDGGDGVDVQLQAYQLTQPGEHTLGQFTAKQWPLISAEVELEKGVADSQESKRAKKDIVVLMSDWRRRNIVVY